MPAYLESCSNDILFSNIKRAEITILNLEQITIGITTFRREKNLKRAINSIISQRSQNIVLIIVSTEQSKKTEKIVREYQEISNTQITYYEVIDEINPPQKARNLILNKCKTEYLFYLDDDDYLNQVCIKELYNKSKLLNSNSILIPQSTSVLYTGRYINFTRIGKVPYKYSLTRNIIGTSFLARTELYKSVNGWDENLPSKQDWDIILRLYKKGADFYFSKKSRIYRTQSVNSISKSISKKNIANQILIRKHKLKDPKIQLDNIYKLIDFNYMSFWLQEFFNSITFKRITYLDKKFPLNKSINKVIFLLNGWGLDRDDLFAPLSESIIELSLKNDIKSIVICFKDQSKLVSNIQHNRYLEIISVKKYKSILGRIFSWLVYIYCSSKCLSKASSIYSHIHGINVIIGVLFKYIYKIRFVYWLAGDGKEQMDLDKRKISNLTTLAHKIGHYYADHIITGCKELAYLQAQIYNKNSLSKYFQIGNSVNIKRFIPVQNTMIKELRKKFNINNDTFVVLFPSRQTYRKGIDIFIETAKLINQYKDYDILMLSAGRGDFGKTYAIKNKMCSYYRDMGSLPSDQIGKLMQCSDLACVPARYQGFSRAYLECIACGVPIVTTKKGCTTEFIKDGYNGTICLLNPSKIKEIILNYYHMEKEERSNIKRQARLSALKYSSKEFSSKLETIFTN